MTRLYSINTVQLALTKSNPPDLLITVIGQAATTGWTDISLEPEAGEPSPDGILDLNFAGKPPQEVFVPYLVPAVAHYVQKDAEKIVGVTVHARTNQVSRLLHEPEFAAAGHLPTLAAGEEHPPGPTTLIFGEEGHGPSTMIAGEEGITHFFGETPTFFPGEHGSSNPIAEHPSNYLAEGPSSPIGEQSGPQPDPWSPVERGGVNAFGRR